MTIDRFTITVSESSHFPRLGQRRHDINTNVARHRQQGTARPRRIDSRRMENLAGEAPIEQPAQCDGLSRRVRLVECRGARHH